jgi:hypothetical protein
MKHRTLLAILIAVALGLGAVACSKTEPEVVAFWPTADNERSVPKPPEPPRWPLSGMEAPSFDVLTQRVVSVKIENSPEARPQTNLQLADVVYESVTEGGITRFNAIFHSNSPSVVGPVRSARLSDLHVVPQYHALFVFSGASTSVNSAIRSAKLENLSEDAGITKPYTRSSKRARPHNLYTDVNEARAEGERRGMKTELEIKGLAFDRRSIDSTPTVTKISIPFSQVNKVEWTYDAASRTYLRANNGKAFMDEGTGKQLGARNVVVIWAQHKVASRDKVGSTTYEIVLSGSGRATVFHDGQRLDCTWEATKDAPPVFKAADGTQVKLAPGNTWMQVINTNINITMK